ncbi:MAG: hypothetical protein WDA06_00880 [Phenylobacterium sp.]
MTQMMADEKQLANWIGWAKSIELPFVDYHFKLNIVASGRSGLLVGFPLSYFYLCNLYILPGSDDFKISKLSANKLHIYGHKQKIFNTSKDIGDYIFIDDCVDSGTTLKNVISSVRGKCRAVLCYAQGQVWEHTLDEIKSRIKKTCGKDTLIYLNDVDVL